jgi:hypothetical protein
VSDLADAELVKMADEVAKVMAPDLTARGVGFVLLIVDPDSGRHVIRTNGNQTWVSTVLQNALKFAKSHRGFS